LAELANDLIALKSMQFKQMQHRRGIGRQVSTWRVLRAVPMFMGGQMNHDIGPARSRALSNSIIHEVTFTRHMLVQGSAERCFWAG
jgi:hypothetical protein